MTRQKFQSESQTAEPSVSEVGSSRPRRDPFGRTLEDARRDDRNWFELRRRRLVRWIVRVRDLYTRIYHAVLIGGLASALLGLLVPIYGLLLLNWREPSSFEIFGAALALMATVIVAERLARKVTLWATSLVRALAAREGIELPAPVVLPWQRPRKAPPMPVPQRDGGGRFYLE